MDKSTYNRTYQALTKLFLNCKKTQEEGIVKIFRSQDQLAHAKEFGTIKMCGPRRSGHTSSIARLLNNLNGNWTVVNLNLAMAERSCSTTVPHLDNHEIIKRTKTNITTKDININFISIHQIDQMRGVELDGIIVDCACFIKRKQKEELYRTCLPCMQLKDYVFFMFIG
jgi:hypothetical protein